MVELVLPLAITVLVVQNGQGIAVLKAAGHEPPVGAVTVACGIGAVLSAGVGAISTCLTGPTNAIITAFGGASPALHRGHVHRHAGDGLRVDVAGLHATDAPSPKAFIMVLAGLAMLRVLQSAFKTAFGERFTLGALVAFLVTAADLGVFNIGAAFWGLVVGFAVSWCLERQDFAPQSASFAMDQRLRAIAAGLHRLVVASGRLIDEGTPLVKGCSEEGSRRNGDTK